jgi:V/A-type H+-transporting ATPase subunit D
MARLQLNKSSLAREQKHLRTYERFLPSLDLKRQQLMGERARARHQIEETRRRIEDLAREVGRTLPMMANENVISTGSCRSRRSSLVRKISSAPCCQRWNASTSP